MNALDLPNTAERDGRWLATTCIALYLAALFTAHYVVNYRHAWSLLGVPAAAVLFEDLRGTLGGAQTARDGLDPLMHNAYDPTGAPANYPRLWFTGILALHLDASNPDVLGTVLAFGFFLSAFAFIGRLSAFEGALWGLMLCSPPIMLAVERGNNDLFVFALLALALTIRPWFRAAAWVSYALIGLAALLKFFPVAAYCIALREKRARALGILVGAGLAFTAYLYMIRLQVKAIRAAVPQPHDNAFGCRVFADWYAARHGELAAHFVPVLLVAVLCAIAGMLRLRTRALPTLPERAVNGLIAGGALYAFSFVLNSNYNYRLIFLLFTLPALMKLLNEHNYYRSISGSLLVLMIVGFAFSNQTQPALFVLKEAANWTILFVMMFLLFHCLHLPWRSAEQTAMPTLRPG